MPQKFQPARLRTQGDNMSESMGENISESLGDFVGIGTDSTKNTQTAEEPLKNT
jgi:hypothetical protein